MAMVIKPKRKFTAGAPSTSDIVEGEIAINTADKKLYVRDNSNNIIEIGGGGAGGSTTEVTQSSHGFAVKDAIRHNGTAWVKAQSNSASTLALGVVVVVTDSNNFTVAQSGRFELSSHGLTVGQWYYLSASSAGGLVTTEPTFSQPIVYVESSTHIFVYPYRPSNLLISGTSDIIPGDNRVTTAKIADDAVTQAKIADDAVGAAQLASSAVVTASIVDDAITSAKIADDAVAAAAIADNSIDIARLNVSDGSNGQALTTNGSGTLSFALVGTADGSISTAKLADDAVTSAKIADNAVDIARLNVSDGSSGQVLTTNGSGTLSFATVGGAYNAWSVKTANYTAVSKDQLIVNSSSAKTITLPSSPSAGDTVVIRATGGGLVTVGRNSSNINSAAADGTLGSGSSTQLVYVDGTIGWLQI